MKKRYIHKSKWKCIIVQEEAEQVVFLLNNTGKLVTPLDRKKHRDLKVLMNELGFLEQKQDKPCERDEANDKMNGEKSFKLVFDENILSTSSNNHCDENYSTAGLTDGHNEYL